MHYHHRPWRGYARLTFGATREGSYRFEQEEKVVTYLTERAGLEGKVAVVTGGAGGLGWPIAYDLAQAGVRVAVCYRDPEAVATAKKAMDDLPVPSLVQLADVRDPDAVAAC